MKKSLPTILIMIMVLFTLSTSVSFASNKISVSFNDGEYQRMISFDTSPVIRDGRLLVPMRALFEEFGYSVDWIAKDQAVRAVQFSDDMSQMSGIIMWINDYEAKQQFYVWDSNLGDYVEANVEYPTMEVAPQIINGRVMIPLRFISETLGYYVTWYSDTKLVYISVTDPSITEYVEPTSELPIDSQPVSDEQKAINNQYVQLFDEPVDSAPGAFQ